MKIKGMRWVIIGLIMMITIINYLDRGTLNYMWVANVDYQLVEQPDAPGEQYIATRTADGYRLVNNTGKVTEIPADLGTIKEKDGKTFVTVQEGMAVDLGLIDPKDPIVRIRR